MTSRAEPLAAEWHQAGSGRRLRYVFARDFTTADGHRVMVAALTPRQFADLATMARLARTFAFLERLLPADFSTRGDRSIETIAGGRMFYIGIDIGGTFTDCVLIGADENGHVTTYRTAKALRRRGPRGHRTGHRGGQRAGFGAGRVAAGDGDSAAVPDVPGSGAGADAARARPRR